MGTNYSPRLTLFAKAQALMRLMWCRLVTRQASMVVTWAEIEPGALQQRCCCNSTPPVVDVEDADRAVLVDSQLRTVQIVVAVAFADVQYAMHQTPRS